ncbi:unnamed protein product [Soboliphyme baturini]|uniref:Uncharacterized protein n=1 Tax=Soboliphyme baturini TaxID=241478 RepID=A0A183IAU2_9BILA|nr:unnamed protein product [Soboliphyme baturini]
MFHYLIVRARVSPVQEDGHRCSSEKAALNYNSSVNRCYPYFIRKGYDDSLTMTPGDKRDGQVKLRRCWQRRQRLRRSLVRVKPGRRLISGAVVVEDRGTT